MRSSPKFAWDGTVCMATILGNSVMVFQFSARTQIYFFYKMLKVALGPPRILFNGPQEPFPGGINHPGHEIDHLPPTSAKIRTVWSYTSTPTYVGVPFIPVFPGQSQFYG